MEERGVRALPADATPARRSRAEAVWRASDDPDASCRWLRHGQAHEHRGEDDSPCSGRMLHADRYPGSLLELTTWHDEYVCDTCDESADHDVRLPEIPWDERLEADGNGSMVYDGCGTRTSSRSLRMPRRRPTVTARAGPAGGYAFAGLLCDGCRREGGGPTPTASSKNPTTISTTRTTTTSVSELVRKLGHETVSRVEVSVGSWRSRADGDLMPAWAGPAACWVSAGEDVWFRRLLGTPAVARSGRGDWLAECSPGQDWCWVVGGACLARG